MTTALDCLPCFVRQSLNVARLVTADEQVQERIMRAVLQRISQMDLAQSPPVLAHWIHRQVRQLTGQADPYLAAKQASNRLALALLPQWQQRLQAAEDPRLATVKLAIAANLIDFGVKGDLRAEDIPAAMEESFAARLEGNGAEFFAAVASARDILFLLKFKCPIVARHIGHEMGSLVIHRNRPSIPANLREGAELSGRRG